MVISKWFDKAAPYTARQRIAIYVYIFGVPEVKSWKRRTNRFSMKEPKIMKSLMTFLVQILSTLDSFKHHNVGFKRSSTFPKIYWENQLKYDNLCKEAHLCLGDIEIRTMNVLNNKYTLNEALWLFPIVRHSILVLFSKIQAFKFIIFDQC